MRRLADGDEICDRPLFHADGRSLIVDTREGFYIAECGHHIPDAGANILHCSECGETVIVCERCQALGRPCGED